MPLHHPARFLEREALYVCLPWFKIESNIRAIMLKPLYIRWFKRSRSSANNWRNYEKYRDLCFWFENEMMWGKWCFSSRYIYKSLPYAMIRLYSQTWNRTMRVLLICGVILAFSSSGKFYFWTILRAKSSVSSTTFLFPSRVRWNQLKITDN